MSNLEKLGKLQNRPLIGLEYVIELIGSNAKEPAFAYFCTLCNKRCSSNEIIQHITSQRHRMRYLDTHFASLMTHLNTDTKFNKDMHYREEIVVKISSMVEFKAGRFKPMIYDYSRFNENKRVLVEEMSRKKHFNENDWPGCVEEILEKLKSIKEDVEEDEDESRNDSDDFNDCRGYNSFHRHEIATSHNLLSHCNNELQLSYIREKYETQVNAATNDINKKYEVYAKNLEEHPSYSEEWKAFWVQRFKQLYFEGKETENYDYKPEWKTFWMKRIWELRDKDIKTAKAIAKNKMELLNEPDSEVESSSSWANQRKRSRSVSPKQETELKKNRYHVQNKEKNIQENTSNLMKNIAKDRDTIGASNNDPIFNAKMQIAAAITDNLMKEGRNNVSPEELEALVECFMNAADDESVEVGETKMETELDSETEAPTSKQMETEETETENEYKKLNDEDIRTLLKNFTALSSDEQSNLIDYLSELDKTNPQRVENLRKYVNMGGRSGSDSD